MAESDLGEKVPPAFDCMGNVIKDFEAGGFNPGLIVLLLVGGLLLAFLIGNYVLHMYTRKNLIRGKRSQSQKKKMKRQKLKQVVSASGE